MLGDIMQMNKYIRVTNGLHDKGKLVTPEEFQELLKTKKDTDFYYSTYYYNDAHLEQFKKTGSVKGITDVKGDTLNFDFDSTDFEEVRRDAKELINRFVSSNIKSENFKVFFSGKKGVHVQLKLDKQYNPVQLQHLAIEHFGKDLQTLDLKVYNPSRVFRLPYSKHQDTDVYKQQLTKAQLENLSIDTIKETFKNQCVIKSMDLVPYTINDSLLPVERPKKEVKLSTPMEQPTHWKTYKWKLLNAEGLKVGERDEALMILAATVKGLGYNREIAESFLNYFDERYASATKQELNPEKIEEKLNNVFQDGWQGGTYTYKNHPWLKDYCTRIGINMKKGEDKVKNVSELLSKFENFSLDFEKNILKTGIKEIDDNILFLSGTHNGILGQPGSAKTTILLRWLANLSKSGTSSMFYSLDMSEEAIYAKLVQFVTGLDFDKAVKLRKTNPTEFAKVSQQINEDFKNVDFNFTSGTSVQSIENDIIEREQATGKKIKFLGVDYLECIQGPYQDATANTGFISQQLKDLARAQNLCSVILLQTQKHGGEVSEPLLSMKRIKGSSAIEQSASVILTLWREGYDPRYQEDDVYLSFAAVKNRFGRLWSDDFGWNGAKGTVTTLTVDGRKELKQLRERKKSDKTAEIEKGWD